MNMERISRKIPYGFTLAGDGVSLVEQPEEQTVLGLVNDLRRAGLTLRGIAAELTQRGIAKKEGGTS